MASSRASPSRSSAHSWKLARSKSLSSRGLSVGICGLTSHSWSSALPAILSASLLRREALSVKLSRQSLLTDFWMSMVSLMPSSISEILFLVSLISSLSRSHSSGGSSWCTISQRIFSSELSPAATFSCDCASSSCFPWIRSSTVLTSASALASSCLARQASSFSFSSYLRTRESSFCAACWLRMAIYLDSTVQELVLICASRCSVWLLMKLVTNSSFLEEKVLRVSAFWSSSKTRSCSTAWKLYEQAASSENHSRMIRHCGQVCGAPIGWNSDRLQFPLNPKIRSASCISSVLVAEVLNSARSVWPSIARKKMHSTSKKALLLPVFSVSRESAGVLVRFYSLPTTSRIFVIILSCCPCVVLSACCLETEVLLQVGRYTCAEVRCEFAFVLFMQVPRGLFIAKLYSSPHF